MESKEFRDAKRIVKRLGLRLEVSEGEYRVMDGDDRHTYYADTLEDAVSTAQDLADERKTARVPLLFCARINNETHVTHLSIETAQLSFDVLLSPEEVRKLAREINDAVKVLSKD